MELQTYGSEERLALPLPPQCTCETALQLIAQRLDIRGESMTLFGLFCGRLGAPIKVLAPSDIVPIGTELCLQRWYMRTDEGRVLKHDINAIHHLYCEAREKLKDGDMSPSEEQLAELDSFSDPFFPTERQYLDVARGVPGYTAIIAKGCTVNDVIEDNAASVATGTVVSMCMDLEGLSLTTEDVRLHWPWMLVRKWKRLSSTQSMIIAFEVCVVMIMIQLHNPPHTHTRTRTRTHTQVCLNKGSAGILSWVSVTTPQAHLLFQGAGSLCAEVKRLQDLKKVGRVDHAPSVVGKFYDPLKEWVDNVLFAEPKFSKLK